eukprot:TRINITY_DN25489_c0_g1_i1.p2 TRINITY_DN25489_c0_g1~~TRINITY_DN25489_c0_g1_i1.p2  ORF type:complete len:148 (+),score=28.55 TRINITY_DN25489_c0_g1_i1:102-545(+)
MIRRIRSSRKRPPAGWDEIEPQFEEFERQMREAENEGHEGKRKCELTWKITQINHERTRYLHDLYHKDKKISKELYDFCVKHKLVDAALLSKWKKSGYEKLCCMKCISNDHNFGGVCICRVPKEKRADGGAPIECKHCGCRGCASCD